MHKPNDRDSAKVGRRFGDSVGDKERRRLRARRQRRRSHWFWLAMFGLVGWSVVIPTLIGLAIGVWLDQTWPSRLSFTLMGLIVGVALGCLIAWDWMKRESKRE